MGSRALIVQAREHAPIRGPPLHPFKASLLRRGLKTYGPGIEWPNANTLEVARFLEGYPQLRGSIILA
jgi:cystathionine beta-lyase/cystathionine gamma-synthase